MLRILSDDEINQHLRTLDDWQLIGGQLHKKFLFKDFSSAMAFMVRVGIISEKMDHHPEMNNVYNQVTLQISTHSMRGITNQDIQWVQAVDQLQ